MPLAPRQMRLTAEHVRRVHRDIADPGPIITVPGIRIATDADYDENVARMLATRPPGPFWIFGISSLIWKPETAFEEKRLAVLRGWHRRFCLGWDHRYRGNREQPALMMALDRGGQCKGMAFRLPETGLEAELHKLIRREMSMVPSAFPWRWVEVLDETGQRLTVMTFCMNRKSGRYIADLTEDRLVAMLATAVGFRGTMAEYLLSTVTMLEQLGIHDRNLWRLQTLVAAYIEAANPTEP